MVKKIWVSTKNSYFVNILWKNHFKMSNKNLEENGNVELKR